MTHQRPVSGVLSFEFFFNIFFHYCNYPYEFEYWLPVINGLAFLLNCQLFQHRQQFSSHPDKENGAVAKRFFRVLVHFQNFRLRLRLPPLAPDTLPYPSAPRWRPLSPGNCTAWVASKITGYPISLIWVKNEHQKQGYCSQTMAPSVIIIFITAAFAFYYIGHIQALKTALSLY